LRSDFGKQDATSSPSFTPGEGRRATDAKREREVWFLRHGESEANSAGCFAGKLIDSPLTDKGRSQAHHAARHLPGQLDWVLSSPLSRAFETAQIVVAELNLTVTIELDDRLSEYDVGSAGGMPIVTLSASEMEEQFGAESAGAFSDRVRAAYSDISLRDGVGLVVAHGGVARMIATNLAGLPASSFRNRTLLTNGRPVIISSLASELISE